MTSAPEILHHLRTLGDPARAQHSLRFFRTGPGEYGAGDEFLGITVPQLRSLVKELRALPLKEVGKLLQSPLHEARLLALLILVAQYQRGDDAAKQRVFDAYLKHRKWINNWDLVDSSAPHILGAHLETHPGPLLRELAQSASLWDRRLAMIATQHFIRRGDNRPTFEIAGILLHDEEDLIHKAVGWMLREAGKRDQPALEAFLHRHGRTMPRSMLRYAIERFEPAARRRYLRGD